MIRPIAPDLPITGGFQPSEELGAWARATFIEPDGPLANPDHAHLEQATFGWLWTNYPASQHGRAIAGEARIPRSGGARWSQHAGVWQVEQWFGHVPNFIITISTEAAAIMDDPSFCALVEHELYHCAQAIDEFGSPRFDREGMPIWTMRGHDVEQFVGVVERYGADATGTRTMIEAAKRGPTIGLATVSAACGSCQLRKVA